MGTPINTLAASPAASAPACDWEALVAISSGRTATWTQNRAAQEDIAAAALFDLVRAQREGRSVDDPVVFLTVAVRNQALNLKTHCRLRGSAWTPRTSSSTQPSSPHLGTLRSFCSRVGRRPREESF